MTKKNLLLLIILCCMLLTACTRSVASEVESETESKKEAKVMGRYTETIVELPECFQDNSYFIVRIQNLENEILVYGMPLNEDKNGKVFKVNNENKLEDITPEWIKTDNPRNQMQDLVILPSGNAYAAYEDRDFLYASYDDSEYIDNISMKSQIKYYDKEKNAWQVIGGIVGSQIEALENETFMVNGGGCYTVYKRGEKEFIGKFNGPPGVKMMEPDVIVGYNQQRSNYSKIEIDSGEMKEELTDAGMLDNYDLAYGKTDFVRNQKGDYVMSPKGIYYRQKDAKTWQQLVDGELCQGLKSQSYSMGFGVGNDNDFYVATATGDNQQQIFRYHYNKNIETQPEHTLKVYTLKQNDALLKASAIFMNKHPDYLVSIEVPQIRAGSIEIEDSIKKINTTILAGKGPDVMILDGLPWESYVQKDVLMNLKDSLGNILNNEKYLINILNAYRKDNDVYAVPTRFAPIFFVGSQKIKPYTESIFKLSEFAKHQQVFTKGAYVDKENLYTSFIIEFYNIFGNELFDENGSISNENLQKWMEAVKSIYVSQNKDELGGQEASTVYQLYDILEAKQGNLAIAVDEGKGREIFQSNDKEGYATWYSEKFYASSVIGVNASTREKESAIEFLEILFTDEVQKTRAGFYPGISVKKDLMLRYAKELQDDIQPFLEIEKMPQDFILKGVTDKDLKWYQTTVEAGGEALKYNRIAQDEELSVLLELLPAYLDGKRTKEDIANDIINRLNLMQNE